MAEDTNGFQRDYNLKLAEWRGEMLATAKAHSTELERVSDTLTALEAKLNRKLDVLEGRVTSVYVKAWTTSGIVTLVMVPLLLLLLKKVFGM